MTDFEPKNAILWPELVLLDLTSRCNLQCIMCVRHSKFSHTNKLPKQDLPDRFFQKLTSLIKNAKTIEFSGLGEPTFHPKFLDYLSRIKEINPKIKITLFTNGQLLGDIHFLRRLVYLIDSLHLSLNGTSTYETIMLGGNFKKLCSNLALLNKVEKEQSKVLFKAVGFICFSKNIKDIISVVKFAKKFGFNSIIYKYFWVIHEVFKKQALNNNAEFMAKAEGLLLKAKTLAEKTGISVDYSEIISGDDGTRNKCDMPWKRVRVTDRGQVLLCCNRPTYIGNLASSSFEDIWWGEKAGKYRQGLLSGNPYRHCTRCKELSLVKKSDLLEINKTLINEYNQTRNISDKQYICYAPFKNIYFNVLGNAAPCWSSFNGDDDKYPEQSIKQIWFGKRFNKVREQIKNGCFPEKCKSCKDNFENRNYTNILAKAYDVDSPIKKYPSILELELDNTCNLACIMCNRTLSSGVAAKEGGLSQTSPYNNNFVAQLAEIMPYLDEIRFNGGECFLIKIYYRIWDEIIKTNPRLKITLATNGTIFNTRIKRLISKANFNINISIDSLEKKTYEYIRKNAVFEKTMNNFLLFHKFCKENKRILCIVTNPLRCNWREMPKFIEFANKYDVPIWFNTIVEPRELGLWSLSAQELQIIYDTLSKYRFEASSENAWQEISNISVYNNLVHTQIRKWLEAAYARELVGIAK